jgi:hypothetical protein
MKLSLASALMPGSLFKGVLYLLLFCCLLQSCRKEEPLFVFKEKDKQPPATNKDTAISVVALLNGDSFKALGRATAPHDSLTFSFFNVEDTSYLNIRILADTPGTYLMGRSQSAYTAIYYASALDKINQKGYTSRATEEAGGTFTVTDIDTISHKIKGSFDLTLLSRTDSGIYAFRQGNFDVLYNHAELEMEGRLIRASPIGSLRDGTATAPAPAVLIKISDTLQLSIAFSQYKGLGLYEMGSGLTVKFFDLRDGSFPYTAENMEVNLRRFNFGEFIQFTFSGKLKTSDGTIKTIEKGSFVVGN